MYCLKCKKKTETIDINQVTTKNGRRMLKGVCSVCGSKKSQFVAHGTTGKGFSLNSLVNNLPIELHQFAERGEYVPEGSFNNQQKYSYCGPGTR